MTVITNWRAYQSAGTITVYGIDGSGNPVKITGVMEIAHSRGVNHPIAKTRNGQEYQLGEPV